MISGWSEDQINCVTVNVCWSVDMLDDIEGLKQISETFHIVVGWHVPVYFEIADNRKTGGHHA